MIRLDVSVGVGDHFEVAGPYSRYNARAKATLVTSRPDGQLLVTLWGGRRFLTGPQPAFEMEYEGYIGPYSRAIDLLDTCADRPWLFEAWYREALEIHTYAFHKVRKLTDRMTGESVDGVELCRLLGGELGGAKRR